MRIFEFWCVRHVNSDGLTHIVRWYVFALTEIPGYIFKSPLQMFFVIAGPS